MTDHLPSKRKWGEHPNDGKGLERISARLKADQLPSKDLTFEERCAQARKAAVGDRWRKRKQREHFCEILANDGHGNLRLAHWNGRVTHKWYHYLASEYEPVPAVENSVPTKEQCKCTMSQSILGDGCEVCNPKQALEYAKEQIADLKRDNVRWENAHQILLADNDRLRKQVEELSIHAEKWVKRALGSTPEPGETLSVAMKEAGSKVFGGQWIDHAADCKLGIDDEKCSCGLSDWLRRNESYLGIHLGGPAQPPPAVRCVCGEGSYASMDQCPVHAE